MKPFLDHDAAGFTNRAGFFLTLGGVLCTALVLFGYVGDPNVAFYRPFGRTLGEAFLILVFFVSVMASMLTILGIVLLVYIVLIPLGIVGPPILDMSKTVSPNPTTTDPAMSSVWDRDFDGP